MKLIITFLTNSTFYVVLTSMEQGYDKVNITSILFTQ